MPSLPRMMASTCPHTCFWLSSTDSGEGFMQVLLLLPCTDVVSWIIMANKEVQHPLLQFRDLCIEFYMQLPLCNIFPKMHIFPLAGGSAKVVSRNCTESGWSEPFPHYYDACGFDESENITMNQVGREIM